MNYNIISFLNKIKELNPEIQSYYFNVFPTNNMLQKEQNFNESEKKQINKALAIREKFGFSFCDVIATMNRLPLWTSTTNENIENVFSLSSLGIPGCDLCIIIFSMRTCWFTVVWTLWEQFL